MSDDFVLVFCQSQLSLQRHREAWMRASLQKVKESNVPWPTLKCGSDKECEHGLSNVVKVEAVTLPGSLNSRYVALQQKHSLAQLLGLQKIMDKKVHFKTSLHDIKRRNGEQPGETKT